MLQSFWTGGKPPQAERTHVWNVSGTRWEGYAKDQKLESRPFSCAGVHGLYVRFYPKGKGKEGKVGLSFGFAPGHDTVMVQVGITLDGCYKSKSPGVRSSYSWAGSPSVKEAYNSITVELLDVKRKLKPEEVVQVACIAGERLWVTAYTETAIESFGVVGGKHDYIRPTMNGLLGQTGEVLEVAPTAVLLKHDNGAKHWWGHGSLSKLLTTDEINAMTVVMLKQHLRDRKLDSTGLKADLTKRLKEAETKELLKQSFTWPPGKDEVKQGSAMADPENAGTVKKRLREGDGVAKAAKRPKLQHVNHDDLLLLFPMQSSEVTLRRAGREAGGASAGSSSFFLRAGQGFEVVVSIKAPLGPVTGSHVVPMMQAINIHTIPEGLVAMTGEAALCTETGTARFPVRIEKSGDFEVFAAVNFNMEWRTIGQKTRVRVAPGAMHFSSLDVKASAEVGEQVQLVLQRSDKDVFGNNIEVPLSPSAKADLHALLFQGVWLHEGKEWPLNLSQPIVTEGGLVVAELRLMLAGRHTFLIKSAGQELTANIEITPGLPASLHLIGDGKPHVLQQIRWRSKIELLNRQEACVANVSGQEVSVELVPMHERSRRSYEMQIEPTTYRESAIKGCSLADIESGIMVQDLEIFLPETDDAPPPGTYLLRVKRATDGCELKCEPSTIHLDLPLDPAAWTSQDLAQSLRVHGLLPSTATELFKDEFDAEIDGKVLIQRGTQKAWTMLKDSLFIGRRFSNRQEKDAAEEHIQKFAKSLFERHTLAGLGKGKYRSDVAKSISEFDLNLEPVSFDTGGYSEIFRGNYEGRSVAVKIPLVKNRGMEVGDHTTGMMKEVERELSVTKACRHPHVVQVIGLMVGPGRIGIVMELCDTSLAKRLQEPAVAINWAEIVRLLMDGTAGLAFIHQHKKTTHGDLKPDNLLIQQGRLKVADFGLATVRRTITNLTGEVSRKGTTYFMAPENVIGPGSDQPSTDVWSFGCVIANVVTGRSPFSEDKSEQALLMSLRQKKPVYAKPNVLPGCPQKLLELIDRCTHYDATMRPSMTDIERELRMVLQSIQSQDGFGLPALWQERGCLLDSPEQLLECQAGSRDHDLIKARLEQEMGNSTTVLKVEMNANVDLLRRYHLERKKVAEENGGDANEVWLWHATSSNVAEKTILKEGFDLNRCGLDFEYYGAGTYLAPDCKLSNRYAAKSETRSMLLVRVACGKIFERTPLHLSPEYQAFLQELGSQQVTTEHRKKLQQDKTRELLRMPKNRSCPNGYNSQLGVDVSGSRKSKTEVVVNKNFQVYPAYRITYRPGGGLPDPLKHGKHSLKTFDEYKASDFHREAQNVLL